jgi:hypothetical protein
VNRHIPFREGRKLRIDGVTWYCQSPGSLWETRPEDDQECGFQLFWTDGPAWWLIWPEGGESRMSEIGLKMAMKTAAPYVRGELGPGEFPD